MFSHVFLFPKSFTNTIQKFINIEQDEKFLPKLCFLAHKTNIVKVKVHFFKITKLSFVKSKIILVSWGSPKYKSMLVLKLLPQEKL